MHKFQLNGVTEAMDKVEVDSEVTGPSVVDAPKVEMELAERAVKAIDYMLGLNEVGTMVGILSHLKGGDVPKEWDGGIEAINSYFYADFFQTLGKVSLDLNLVDFSEKDIDTMLSEEFLKTVAGSYMNGYFLLNHHAITKFNQDWDILNSLFKT